MKFKEKRGNTFVFDGGYDTDELELGYANYSSEMGAIYKFKCVYISSSLHVNSDTESFLPYKDIQTAVNLMQILINEGEV